MSSLISHTSHIRYRDTEAAPPSLAELHAARVLGPPRAPTLSPRRRNIDPAVTDALVANIRAVIGTAPETTVEISEWVSVDSRTEPHCVCIVLGDQSSGRLFMLRKASERITAEDLRDVLSPDTV